MTDYEKALALWQRKHITTDAELAEALNGHSISFAYHSGKLENENITYHDTREIFEHDGVTSYTGDLRTLFEIRNAKEANELFLRAFRERRALDEAFVKELQLQLTHGTYDTRRWQLGERPGEYKRHDYVTGCEEVGAAPEDVAARMSAAGCGVTLLATAHGAGREDLSRRKLYRGLLEEGVFRRLVRIRREAGRRIYEVEGLE